MDALLNLRMRRKSLQVLQQNDIAQRVACEFVNDTLDRNIRDHAVSLGPQAKRRQESGRPLSAN